MRRCKGTIDTVARTDETTLLWGATVNAHAVEGGDFNADWWRWEQRPAHIAGGGTSVTAADHLNRYKGDLDLARKLAITTLRYAISWARVEPEPGVFDERALHHYANVFREMATRGIEPICVLQEHSLPAWFSKMGAWEHPDAPARFAEYARRAQEAVGRHCALWLPHGEPLLWLAMAYGERRWPVPGKHARRAAALNGMVRAHVSAREAIRAANTGGRVGISLYAPLLRPADPYSPWDERVTARTMDWLTNRFPAMLDRHGDAYDFVALTCPGELGVHLAASRPRSGWAKFERAPGDPCPLDGAVRNAAAMAPLARRIAARGKPVLVTAVGPATEDDQERCRQLLDHVSAFLRLRDEGLDLLGFCFQSFLDGFAWQHGFRHREGLVHVDWKTLTRTPNPSAFLFQDIIRAGSIRSGAVTRYAKGWSRPALEAS